MIILIFATLFFGCVGMFAYALLYSRVFFDRYMKLNHPDEWHLLRAGHPAPMLSTDASREMARFRSRVNDDLGDARLRAMKSTSRWLYRCAAGLWLMGVLFLLFLKIFGAAW